jgi:hypothetical protein
MTFSVELLIPYLSKQLLYISEMLPIFKITLLICNVVCKYIIILYGELINTGSLN